MAGLMEYLARIEYTWRYRGVDTCLHIKEFELCISLLTGQMTGILFYEQKYINHALQRIKNFH
jgi:hypothetical protein